MTARERAGNRGLAAARTAVAREYYLLAELVASEDRPFAHNAAAGNAVLAAIAAADAICCLKLGRYHVGEDHRSATRLLATVQPHGQDLAKHLAKVVAIKDQVHYSGDPLSDSRMRSVLRSTAQLVEEAERTMAQA
jgi:hypothetical protein